MYFKDEYFFLSNFYPCTIKARGLDFRSVEHAYQACKFENHAAVMRIYSAETAGKAKRLAREMTLLYPVYEQWDAVKLPIMAMLLHQKFSEYTLRRKLLETGNIELVEENYWNDTFWGVCRGEGSNMLGKLLMEERKKLRNDNC